MRCAGSNSATGGREPASDETLSGSSGFADSTQPSEAVNGPPARNTAPSSSCRLTPAPTCLGCKAHASCRSSRAVQALSISSLRRRPEVRQRRPAATGGCAYIGLRIQATRVPLHRVMVLPIRLLVSRYRLLSSLLSDEFRTSPELEALAARVILGAVMPRDKLDRLFHAVAPDIRYQQKYETTICQR